MGKRCCALLICAVLVIQLCGFSLSAEPTSVDLSRYELGQSTALTGSKQIWVPKEFSDVPQAHWFYEQLQNYRRKGILTGDETGAANLDRYVTAAEIYTIFVRYVYADQYSGEMVNGAIKGDYTYNSHAAWLDAYSEVYAKLESTIQAVGHEVSLPHGKSSVITRKQAFTLYCIAALARCSDPAWYLGQFSSERLGYYARSNAPIKRYGDGKAVASFFAVDDHYSMSALEIQCANMLMYLGVLNGTDNGTLDPDSIITRAQAVKLVSAIDNVDNSPHKSESGSSSGADWGGEEDEYPEPDPLPELEKKRVSITFVDWDDTILGWMSVTTNTDIRQAVSDYVAEHYVHPDLVNADPTSLSRADNYRGEYNGAEDGNSYPLTSHLDYAFVQQPFVATANGGYIQQYSDGKYPFAYGWALCSIKDFQNVWTTLGVGELASWDGSTFTYDGDGFQVADLSKGVKSDVVLKAIYEPGDELKDDYYRMSVDPEYTAYSAPVFSSTSKAKKTYDIVNVFERKDFAYLQIAVFLVDITYERTTIVDGKIYGVTRARNPQIPLFATNDMRWLKYDMEGNLTEEKLYGPDHLDADLRSYLLASIPKVVEHGDSVSTEFSLTGNRRIVDFQLVDTYGSNAVAAYDDSEARGRSRSNEWNRVNDPEHWVMDNFNYLAPSSTINDDWYDCGTDDILGTRGFVSEGSLNLLARRSYEVIQGGGSDRLIQSEVGLYVDFLNLWYNGEIANYWSWWRGSLCTAIRNAYQDVVDNHYQEEGWWNFYYDHPKLSYHQLQLFLMDWEKYEAGELAEQPTVKPYDEAEAAVIPWCNLHQHCKEGG